MDISVIIPVYNSEKTIIHSVESVVNSIEKYTKNYEILCIDDGSKDNSYEKILSLSKKNNCVIAIHQENAGVATARNVGLKIAKGKYIAFNDSDDEWLENHFQVLFNLFNTYPDLYCISGNHDCVKQKIPRLNCLSNNFYRILLKDELLKNYFSPQATMIKREIVENGIFFKKGMRYAEEGYFFYSIVAKYNCAYINEEITKSILCKEKFGDGGLSGNLKEMEKGELFNLKYAHKELKVSLFYYWFTVIFSVLKYLRRVIIVHLRKGKKNEKNNM